MDINNWNENFFDWNKFDNLWNEELQNYIDNNTIMQSNGQGVGISDMANIIKDTLNDYCGQQGGVAVIAADPHEKLMIGYNNAVGIKCLICFVGEESDGDASISDATGRVKRDFDIIIQRGKILSEPRNTSLTTHNGPARDFYSQVEEIRDLCRCIIWPTPFVHNPANYNSLRPGQSDGWLMDSYILSFSLLTQIGRVAVNPPQLSRPDGSPFVQLEDPEGIQQNQSFPIV